MAVGAESQVLGLTLAIIIGVLAAIVYSLRILVLLERRIARVDLNIERMTKVIAREEFRIEKKEGAILRRLKKGSRKGPKKRRTVRKTAKAKRQPRRR